VTSFPFRNRNREREPPGGMGARATERSSREELGEGKITSNDPDRIKITFRISLVLVLG